jgi:hypothetical protein
MPAAQRYPRYELIAALRKNSGRAQKKPLAGLLKSFKIETFHPSSEQMSSATGSM